MFDYNQARRYQEKKQATLKAQRFSLWQKAEKDAYNIIQMIIDKYEPEKIIQWGSVLESKHFSEASDIDLAVVGIDSIKFMQLLADAEDLSDFALDIIRWENIHSSFQKIILMKGKIVYGN